MNKIRSSGGCRQLASFRTATLIYDSTVWFCERFIDARSRTVDQMVQAARSGRQNMAEGSRAAAASSQTELRLVNVARASLECRRILRIRFQQHTCPSGRRTSTRQPINRDIEFGEFDDHQSSAAEKPWHCARHRKGQPFWGCTAYPDCKGTIAR